MALRADRVQAAAETYMGLVEVGVGLIPAGGGTKEMLVRAMDSLPTPQSDPLPFVQRAFETVALAKVSASGPDARRLGYLSSTDAFTMNRERLIADAKARALDRVREGYVKPAPRTSIPVGGASLAAALKLGVHLAWRSGRASEHDALIGRTLAVNGQPFEVIGVLAGAGGGFGNQSPDFAALIPLRTAERRVFGQEEIDTISVRVADRMLAFCS